MRLLTVVAVLCLCSCGGETSEITTPPGPGETVTTSLTVNRSEVAPNASTTVTWTSTNATSCTASGGWSGTRATSGSESLKVTGDADLVLSCSNGSTSGSSTAKVTTLKPTTPVASGHYPWATKAADIDGDGNQELVMATMDGGRFNEFTSPTPVYILAAVNNRLTDRTSHLLATPLLTYNATVVVADLDGDGRMDLMSCDRGRNVGSQPPDGSPLTLGIRGGQNQVFLQRGGVLTNQTQSYPQVIATNWGCSAGELDSSGKPTIAINAFGSVPGYSSAYLLKWDGTKFALVSDLPFQRGSNGDGWGVTTTADYDKNGFADITGGRQVSWGDAGGNSTVLPLGKSQTELAGYDFWRTAATADFTGDGYPDLLKVTSRREPDFTGARFALYVSDQKGALVEKTDAFPALATYNDSDFGQHTAQLDLNFDGFVDIATMQRVYTSFGGAAGSAMRAPTAVWLNDGAGKFKLAHWTDEIQSFLTCTFFEVYFLKTADPKAFNLVVGGCGQGYMTRTVTAAYPMTFGP